MNRWTNILIKRVYIGIKVFLFKSLFFAALHLFKELWKSCLVIPLPCVLTLKNLSLILGFSLDLSLHGNYQVLVTEHSFTATSECILSQFNNFGHFILVKQSDSIQRDGILSTGYFADLTIVFTKLRWKKQSTHVLKKYQFMLWLHFGLHNFFFKI